MRTVWKAAVPLGWLSGRWIITVPLGTQFLTVANQNEHLCVWYACDPSHPTVEAVLHIVGTGEVAPDGKYLGTAQFSNGKLVLHVFTQSA